MEKGLVSVIMPVYNNAHLITDAINSVKNQTYKNTEIIVIDDGSSDDIKAVVSSFPDIKFFSQTNKGPAAARNLGIRHAQGEYIAFLDSDDVWEKHKLEEQIKYFSSHPQAVFVYTAFYNESIVKGGKFKKLKEAKNTGEIFKDFFFKKFSILPSSVVVKKIIIDQVGGFDEVLKLEEDRDLFLRIAMKYKIDAINKPLVSRRLHGKNYFGSKYDSIYSSGIIFIDRFLSKFPDTANRLNIDKNKYLGDFASKHTYKAIYDKELLFLFKTAFKSIRFRPLKGLFVLLLAIFRIKNNLVWKPLIADFAEFHQDVLEKAKMSQSHLVKAEFHKNI